MELTDAEVVSVLAERMWPDLSGSFFTSRDAIQPVLAKLSEEENRTLGWRLETMCEEQAPRTECYAMWLLTLPARDLAYAIAEVISK
jgi:hypothetical protein